MRNSIRFGIAASVVLALPPTAAALADGARLEAVDGAAEGAAALGATLAAALGEDTVPGVAQAATRMLAKAMAAKRAVGDVALGRWNRTLAMNAPPRLLSLAGAEPCVGPHPRPSFGGAVVARTTSSGASGMTGGSSERLPISDRSTSAPRRPDSNSRWRIVVRPT